MTSVASRSFGLIGAAFSLGFIIGPLIAAYRFFLAALFVLVARVLVPRSFGRNRVQLPA